MFPCDNFISKFNTTPTNFSREGSTTIRLNFENVKELDKCISEGYKAWVSGSPRSWRADGFLQDHSPIVITSRFGQDAAIAAQGNEEDEALNWDSERDYSKIAYLTIALATSIESVINSIS